MLALLNFLYLILKMLVLLNFLIFNIKYVGFAQLFNI